MSLEPAQSREPPVKRYRKEEPKDSDSSDEWNEGQYTNDMADSFVPYVPVKERRKQKLVKLGRITQIQEQTVTAADDGKNRLAPASATESGASSPAMVVAEEKDDVADEATKDHEIEELARKRKEEEILAKSKETSLLLQHS